MNINCDIHKFIYKPATKNSDTIIVAIAKLTKTNPVGIYVILNGYDEILYNALYGYDDTLNTALQSSKKNKRILFPITESEFIYFKTYVINQKVLWKKNISGNIIQLPGYWFNFNHILVLGNKEKYLQYKQNIKFHLPIIYIDESIESIDFITDYNIFLKFKACYKYSFIINLDMMFPDKNVELFLEKIDILIEQNGIFYCYNPSQLLIRKINENKKEYQLYQLIQSNESISSLIKNNGFKNFILKHFFRLANVDTKSNTDIVDSLYFNYQAISHISTTIQKQYPIFSYSNLENLFSQLLDKARKNNKLSLQEIYDLLFLHFETLYYKKYY